MALKQLHLTVSGRVQGVFFRASTQREAQRLGLTGWVRNRTDGAVEMCVQGDESAVSEMVAWAHHGPPQARVDKVDITDGGQPGAFTDFRVER